jgi:uncharacterized membrane protein
MEELLILLVVGLLVSPMVLSIVALVKVSSLRREVEVLRQRAAGIRPAPVPPVAKPVPSPVVPTVTVSPIPRSIPASESSVPLKKDKPRPGMEFMLGGKAAAFAGAAILVMGIVFLVGYAMQHSWIGPGTRVILGMLFGGALVGIGYGLECRGGGKYGLLARALTGAGSALFYFVVFAAYGIYHLIGAAACGAGLFVSALAVFGLAMVYNSQAVGVLGVLGAFVTPLLIGGDMDKGVFALVYVAVINIPVLLLGVRRKWQLLYNVSFSFTVFYFFAWLDWIGAGESRAGLLFALIYFAEFAALGLLKLRCEQQTSGRRIDIARLLASSLLLLWAVYWILNEAHWNQWVGLTFLLLALLHMGLATLALQLLSRFTEDILAFLGGGLLFAVLALPAQLDGEWVSLGWALEGAVLAWFAVRVKSRTLLGAASLIGLIGIMKALCYDVGLYTNVPNPFWNVRFAVGVISCGLLGLQGWLAGRFNDDEKFSGQWRDILWWGGIIAALIVVTADAFWTLGVTDEWAWLLISMALLAFGTVITLMVRPDSSVRVLGALFLVLLPLQIVWFYLMLGLRGSSTARWIPFSSPAPWLLLAALGTVIFWLQPRMPKERPVGPFSGTTYSLILTMSSLACALLVLTLEIGRITSEWAGPLITILWAVWALALILFGLIRRVAPYRMFGLILFGLTTLKVLLVDASELKGIERIAAFMGAGILLLALSFVYQKVSASFLSTGESE